MNIIPIRNKKNIQINNNHDIDKDNDDDNHNNHNHKNNDDKTIITMLIAISMLMIGMLKIDQKNERRRDQGSLNQDCHVRTPCIPSSPLR